MSTLKKNIVLGFFWSSGGQIAIILIALIANVLLARFLSPEEFGQIGIILFFTTLFNVLVAGGLAGAVVRVPDASVSDFKTVFTFNLGISLLCYLLLVLLAPYIAAFYADPYLQPLLLVSGLILFINAFQMVNNAILIRNMRFKQRTIYNFIAVILSSTLAVLGAYFGMGVWSLVVMQLGTPFFIVVQLILFEKFFIRVGWSQQSFKSLFAFGINTTLANILNTAFINIYNLVLGKYFSMVQVGYFYQAQKLQQVPVNVLNYFTQSVLFSGLSKLQHDKIAFSRAYNKIITLLTVLSGLITIITFLYGREIVLILFGEQWIDAVFYLQLLIIASFFYMQEQFNRVIFKVFDETKQILILELIKKTFQAGTIVIGIIYMNLSLMLWGYIATNLLSSMVNYYYSRRIIDDTTEMVVLLKIISVGIVTVAVGLGIKFVFELTSSFYFLLSLPVVILFYMVVLRLLNIFNIVRDIYVIRGILKG